MKKIGSQIAIAFVCLILGFMIAHQFKMISKQNALGNTNNQNPEIIIENEQLKKQKEEMQKKIDELDEKNKQYENAAGKDKESSLILEELKESRILTGATDVQGEGLIIYLTPKSAVFGSTLEESKLMDYDLLAIVNELKAAYAEAIAINDIRLTSRTGIREAGKGIVINNERISNLKRVVIKAIGRKDLLEAALSFPGVIPEELTQYWDVTWEPKDDIIIPKYNKTYKFEYAKPVEKK